MEVQASLSSIQEAPLCPGEIHGHILKGHPNLSELIRMNLGQSVSDPANLLYTKFPTFNLPPVQSGQPLESQERRDSDSHWWMQTHKGPQGCRVLPAQAPLHLFVHRAATLQVTLPSPARFWLSPTPSHPSCSALWCEGEGPGEATHLSQIPPRGLSHPTPWAERGASSGQSGCPWCCKLLSPPWRLAPGQHPLASHMLWWPLLSHLLHWILRSKILT